MSVKAFLRETRDSLLTIQVLSTRAERYRDMAIQASRGMRSGEQAEKYVLELVDAHAALQMEVRKLLKKQQEAEKMISTLENANHRAVLQLYYLCGCRWQEIAEKTHFTLRWVHALHKAAITELETVSANAKGDSA